jgi:nicotinamide phosphoribosyltransferase
MRIFPPHATDVYKTGHIYQYPPGTTQVYSNFTPRSDKLAKVGLGFDHKVVFFGLQGFLKEHLHDLWGGNFFAQPKEYVLEQYKRRMDGALGEGAVGVEHFAALHDLGYMPLHIKALPEGARVNIKVPLLTVTNTHPDFFWLTNYIETAMSAELWKPITSATTAFELKRILMRYASKTGSAKEFVQWQGHDFSFRGLSGIHDAAVSGAGHLLSFNGTDTIVAMDYLDQYYRGAETFIGGSVPATEHSVMCMGGQDDEVETFRRLIRTYPSGILSVVSDTWDFWKVITETATTLKDEIMARQPDALGNAKLVFRPDSGDPVKIICGDSGAERDTPAYWGAIATLWDVFGGTTTSTGHKLLDSHVGLIYGDSIDLQKAETILGRLERQGYSSGNVVFGVGSFTYQYVTRDSYGTAMKATFGVVNGEDRELFKDPITDSGVKKSAKGLLRVELEDGEYVLYDQQTREQEKQGELKTVYANGEIINKNSLAKIRERLNSFFE